MRLTEIRTDPRPVAVARMGIGVATVFNAFEGFEILQRISDGRLAVPWIAGAPLPSAPLLVVGLIVAVIAGIAVTIGWMTAPAAVVSVLLSATMLLWDQQLYSNHRWFGTLLLAYLVFAQAGTAWSVKPFGHRSTVRWWPQLLMMSQLSVLYVFSALSKMNLVFLSGVPLSGWVWFDAPWQLFFVASILTIVVELIIGIGLWFRASRRVAVLFGLGLHLSIIVLMTGETLPLIAFAISCITLYPLFLFRPGVEMVSTRGSGRAADSGDSASELVHDPEYGGRQDDDEHRRQ
ncbi:HTTM domain-containing protein [Agromyces sp. S2-1-8]|uniref:HTTM domain-containing protein n=1 Tax=Agromyces sp. S2-1-8 TaxID=2897180 RepID=UPI001E29E451|nr:HTTM domain-containing protein [Agromyces sp. S2-1-8]MCD5344946.1 HTTM domain-containing protein [Agromyces sp. S2-1-8]